MAWMAISGATSWRASHWSGAIFTSCLSTEDLPAHLWPRTISRRDPVGRRLCTILQSFVRRPLGNLPFLYEQRIEEPYCDIANAYGYGGPVGIGDDAALGVLAGEFERAFSEYLEGEGIASEFCSLHPLLIEHQLTLLRSGSIVPEYAKDVVVVDTSVSEEALFAGTSRGVRAKVNKARRHGVHVEKVEPSAANLAKFNRLYVATMDRKQAEARWYFPESYFHDCIAELGPNRTSLFCAFVGEEIAAAYVLMHDYATAYYRFGAADERFFDLRPNDILMAETARWAGKQGYRRIIRWRRDGAARDDLLRFKGSFGRGRAPLFTYVRVHNEGI